MRGGAAIRVLAEHGIENALVNAGGDLMAVGHPEGAPGWPITIAHPRKKHRPLAELSLSGRAVVTSGDYERFITVDGKRYSHILDPRTGFPVEGLISTTIICPDAELADALATSVFVLGREQGLALVERLKHVAAIVVDAAGDVHYSRGIEAVSLVRSATR